MIFMLKGDKYGIHRVISPTGVLPQAASKVDNDMKKRYSNEIICDVSALNIDSASFTQIKNACDNDEQKMADLIIDTIAEKGKMQNRVTGSGGMFIGTVSYIGEELADRDLKVGDKIISLVSLSLTPLYVDKILKIHKSIDRVDIKGQAVLFESGLYIKMPSDLSEALTLAAMDVAGAPAQTARLVKPGTSTLILGAAGKAGILCSYEARKQAGAAGNVVGIVYDEKEKQLLESLNLCNHVIVCDATKPSLVLEKALAVNNGKEYDLSICCVNVEKCEISAILPVKDNGIVYFFSMATSFTRSALGAEGIGKDVTMIIGNGYTKGHAEFTLNCLRESTPIRTYYEQKYVSA